jgi:hypothetical protein
MKKALLFIIFVLGIATAGAAVDFGLILDLEPEYASGTDGKVFTHTGNYRPWLSASVSEKTNLYVSARLSSENTSRDGRRSQDFSFEFERMEMNIRAKETAYLTFGRQRYRDDGGMIASGSFDGFHGAFGLGRARITGGVFFTGLLYKKTAEILLTGRDWANYQDSGVYFASRRLLTSAGLEFPDLTSRASLAVSALAQVDLNEFGAAALHSQYLETRYGVEAGDTLRFTFTGIGGLVETGGASTGNLAVSLAADWEIPGNLADMLTGELRWGSGAVNKSIGPFLPVTKIAQGMVFTPTLSGLMDGRISYAARPHEAFSFSAAATVFFRTDLETLADPELDLSSKNRFLGGEFYGQCVWAPQSPLRITAGGGVFLPRGAFVKSAEPRWKAGAGLVFSL